ncbi:GCNT1-like protein [Mya arenaria]|uniref:GCNT1-like protein n=1 Tax=Mya arenaria TaxID=6604 RepID=A0ABY7DDC2_MYAAR|nr:GCNT1-like protein [Mya arenaria]
MGFPKYNLIVNCERSYRKNVPKKSEFDSEFLYTFLEYSEQQDMTLDNVQHENIRSLTEQTNGLYQRMNIQRVVTSKVYFFANKSVLDFNCHVITKGDKKEIFHYILANLENLKIFVSKKVEKSSRFTSNCSHFVKQRGYITNSLTKEEKQFPIDFSILIHTEVKQVETLLRAIYRPQNLYCIHVDTKSSAAFYEEIHAISSCFDNVFLSSQRFDVQWGTMTVLEPEIVCMNDLWNNNVSWKYFINLTGQEFPLRTNFELVKILKAYNGANDISATLRLANTKRWSSAGPAPHNIRPSKGSVHIVASRGYVDYLLHDQRAKDLLEWTRKTDVPDETYFSTLNSNTHLNVPGSYNGNYLANPNHTYTSSLTRYKQWGFDEQEDLCKGKFVRNICILGVGDLQRLAKSEMLFANKFFLDFQPLALECLEELIYNRTRDDT